MIMVGQRESKAAGAKRAVHPPEEKEEEEEEEASACPARDRRLLLLRFVPLKGIKGENSTRGGGGSHPIGRRGPVSRKNGLGCGQPRRWLAAFGGELKVKVKVGSGWKTDVVVGGCCGWGEIRRHFHLIW